VANCVATLPLQLLLLIFNYTYIKCKLPDVDAAFVTDCNDLSLVCKSLVCKNKNNVDEIAISATSSLVLQANHKLCAIDYFSKRPRNHGQNTIKH